MSKKSLIKNKIFKCKIYQDIKTTDKNLNKMMEIKFNKDFKRISKINYRIINFFKLI